MESNIDIKTIIKNAKSACKRDGYPQIIYAYDEDRNDLAFTRLYSELKLTGVKEVIGVVYDGWCKGIYKVYYISDKIDIEQIVKSYEVNFL